ncbi:6-phosphofructokinase [Tissierella creatinophila DSM 6911]|uniref:6-phosphofructokinase n=2 Tax=Tissierella creatinophila TaxID=79681 RepID=A0A1U7M6A4_TISCR|nr:6-phosphofructokinase [Tissierella creatinophila DSM 6911]
MNAAIRAVIRTAIFNNINIVGIKQGYEGLINGEIEEMNLSSVADIIHRGGTILRSSRSEEFMTEEGFKRALNVIKVFGINGIIVLGGDGSFKGARKLANAGVPTMGIPCTIDNDMGYTDYTIGFFTAVETAAEAIGKIRDTSTSHGRANIIEVMGRNSGDIALYSGISGGAESIIVPEIKFNIDEVIKRAIRGRNRGKLHHIIVLAEGVGNPYDLAEDIKEGSDIDTRVTILGHVQRGGTPTSFDRIMASEMGRRAVELLLEGKSGRALGIKCNKVMDLDIIEALDIEKKFNEEMYETAKILSI